MLFSFEARHSYHLKNTKRNFEPVEYSCLNEINKMSLQHVGGKLNGKTTSLLHMVFFGCLTKFHNL